MPGLDRVPLHLNGGVLDLTQVDQTLDSLWLEIDVDAKLNDEGDVIWENEFRADLQIDVQPTLTN